MIGRLVGWWWVLVLFVFLWLVVGGVGGGVLLWSVLFVFLWLVVGGVTPRRRVWLVTKHKTCSLTLCERFENGGPPS